MSDLRSGLPVYSPSAPASGDETLDFRALARRRDDERGGQPWRSLEELAKSPEFEAMLHRDENAAVFESPSGETAGVDRRELFQYLGVSFALAGLTACTRQPAEKIVPYVRQPEEIVPGGKPLFYATAMTLAGSATGLLIESHEGRPTKAEGNPLHPASLGASDPFAQASLYGLYDPDRSQTLLYLEEIRPWASFLGAIRAALDGERASGGAGLRILTETVASPTLARQIGEILRAFPGARWIQWEPAGRDNARAGAKLAFGEPVEPIYRFEDADVILSLDADFLSFGAGHLRSTRGFSSRRRVGKDGAGLNRLYAIESSPGNTGAKADHRLAMRAADVESFARAVAAAVDGAATSSVPPGVSPAFLSALAADLHAHRGRSLVLAGDHQPPAVHAIAHAVNAALGNAGRTVTYVEPAEPAVSDQMGDLRTLVSDMDGGRVRTLIILGGNPVFTAPADFQFGDRLQKVPLRVHLAPSFDETSVACQWHIPEAHFLEAWSDARAFDGTATIVQPLILPLWGGRSAHEVVAAMSDQPEKSAYDIVRDTWRPRLGPDFEAAWRRALHDGVIPKTASAEKSVRAKAVVPATGSASTASTPAPGPAGLEILFRPDPMIHDGRFANNGWLQELPKPLTKLTWDNAAIVSPATAARLGLAKEDVVRLAVGARSVAAPIWIEPGHPDDSVTVHFGYGRTRAGRFGTGAGFNAYAIRSSDALWIANGSLTKTGGKHPLACTQMHQNMEGRDIVRAANAADFRKDPEFAHRQTEAPKNGESMYAPYPSDTYAWAMAIDLNQCVGCNACVIACQSENNIPVVGKDQVRRGREMHWIRLDHYYGGNPALPQHFFQPVPCMHCENAPCELVCPVGATVHSAEGLNDMVYNRCVGTRYCSNNCPYKVRRFNFYHYSTQFRAPSMRMLANPDVTVRWRGVMEKCTYCVQRINGAKIDSELAGRRVKDGEITTACAQACPADAIVFGDLADKESRVSKLREDPRSYGLLEEIGTRPRTTYLAQVRNPNPAIDEPVRRDWPRVYGEETDQQ